MSCEPVDILKTYHKGEIVYATHVLMIGCRSSLDAGANCINSVVTFGAKWINFPQMERSAAHFAKMH